MTTKSYIATLVAKPDRFGDLVRLMTELKTLTDAHEPRTLAYDLWQREDAAHTLVNVACFVDEAAFQHHQGTDYHDRLVPPILDCLAEEMNIAFYRGLP